MPFVCTNEKNGHATCEATYVVSNKGPLRIRGDRLTWPLQKTRCGNVWNRIFTDRYRNITRTVALSVATTTLWANVFFFVWVFAYGTPDYLLTYNGSQFVSKLFDSFCKALGITEVMSPNCHPQTNGLMERYNWSLVEGLRNYVSEGMDD